MEIGSHQAQAIVTITLLVTASLLALFCDYLRYRMYQARVAESSEPRKLDTAISPTLVPEIAMPVRKPRQRAVEPVSGDYATLLAVARQKHQAMEQSAPKKSGVRRAS